MSALLEKVRQALAAFPVHAGNKVLVAVSGGPDSVCLLHLLRSLFPERPLRLYVAHLNHGLRPEAVEEARFVEGLAKDWDLPFLTETLDTVQYCGKESLQVQARRLRYRFLRQRAREFGVKWIAFGHHADDQAETILMRLLRGSGLMGLSGMPAMRERLIIRPLLDCTRNEIISELAQQKLSFIQDPTNKKLIYQRNRIRHHLIPILQSYNPKIKRTLCREATLIKDENDFIEQSLSALLPSLEMTFDRRSVVFKVKKVVALHPALQRRVIRFGLEGLLNQSGETGFEAIEALRQQMLSSEYQSRLSLPHSLIAERRGPRLQVKKTNQGARSTLAWQSMGERVLHEIDVSISNCHIDLPEWGMRLKVATRKKNEGSEPLYSLSACIASFDFDKISLPLAMRSWQPGDRFVPLGMRGHHKKLQDFFVDQKIPRDERHRVPLLCCREGILWVSGLRIDERFCVNAETLQVLTVEMQPALKSDQR